MWKLIKLAAKRQSTKHSRIKKENSTEKMILQLERSKIIPNLMLLKKNPTKRMPRGKLDVIEGKSSGENGTAFKR